MRLLFRWSDRTGEGRLNKADKADMLANCNDIDALDFAKDALQELTGLYNEMLRRFQLRPKHDALTSEEE